jgi:ArsR family metal-binding transcriptional regulator
MTVVTHTLKHIPRILSTSDQASRAGRSTIAMTLFDRSGQLDYNICSILHNQAVAEMLRTFQELSMTTQQTLLHRFVVTQVIDCLADPTKNRVIASLSDDVSPAFPYINATLPNVMYNPGANSLTFRRTWRIVTIYPRVAVMAKVDGEDDARDQLLWFQELCNDVWRRRDEITPLYERRQHLGPLDVYSLLPKLNCKECGEITRLAFAVGLLLGARHVSGCLRLIEDEYAEGGRRLSELLVQETSPILESSREGRSQKDVA